MFFIIFPPYGRSGLGAVRSPATQQNGTRRFLPRAVFAVSGAVSRGKAKMTQNQPNSAAAFLL
ncbi:MAG: hypothetical protein DBY05_02330 [Clostridiales bacterium]|jgi:hypothetical protein|nr:MAG: hypothetical protein DBY05_02330 [Clostridiales bacterium]